MCMTALMTLLLGSFVVSCDKNESYSELLRDEEKSVNWFLAGKRVSVDIPADSISFETGENAPFYKLDEDGYIYMQVINKGSDEKAKKGDLVYFRYMRTNIKNLYEGITTIPTGNAENMNSSVGNTAFVFGNYILDSYAKFGSGIQKPLEFLGYNSEVNLVLKSYYGFTSDQSACIPYLINVKYFKAEY